MSVGKRANVRAARPTVSSRPRSSGQKVRGLVGAMKQALKESSFDEGKKLVTSDSDRVSRAGCAADQKFLYGVHRVDTHKLGSILRSH